VKLTGTRSNRDGIGAKIRLGNQSNHVTTAVGYASSSPSTVHFGTGRLEKIDRVRSEEHTSELQSRFELVCRLLLEKKKCSKKWLRATLMPRLTSPTPRRPLRPATPRARSPRSITSPPQSARSRPRATTRSPASARV